MVVDDEPLALAAIAHMLCECSREILMASSASEALKIWMKDREQIECVVLDIVLPGMSGLELANCLKGDEKGDVKILFISGFSSDSLKVLGHRLPDGARFLQKPFEKEELLESLFGSACD
jgi:CheY-like chemotaxis protein